MENPFILFITHEWHIALVLLGMAVVAVGIIIERVRAYQEFGHTDNLLLEEVLGLVRTGKDTEALVRLGASHGPVASVATVILNNKTRSIAEVERLVQETAEEYFMRLERMLPGLDTITTLSPLWGLFGTIVGMIDVFVRYAQAKDDAGRQGILPGVGTALFATAGGILIAIVCFAAYNYFAARRARVIAETEQAATKLINTLEARGDFSGKSIPAPMMTTEATDTKDAKRVAFGR
jgi:biopolymer transport protein ExbB